MTESQSKNAPQVDGLNLENEAGKEKLDKFHSLVVFFEGTGNTLDPITTQIGLFADACRHTRVYDASDVELVSGINSVKVKLKMSFDGCGVTNGISGTLFATGLDEQVDSVVEVVNRMLTVSAEKNSRIQKVMVVSVGLSRGAMASMKLALKLSDSSFSSRISKSMLLFDPVPGNSIWTGFPYSCVKCQDLSKTGNILRRVLALYPYEPLPDVAMHAPCFPIYPRNTFVEEEVTLGCHQGAVFGTIPNPQKPYEMASVLSFRRIKDFLDSEDVELQFSPDVYQPTLKECINVCQRALKWKQSSNPSDVVLSERRTHDRTGRGRVIVRKASGIDKWLNKHHRNLEDVRIKAQMKKIANNGGKCSSILNDLDPRQRGTGTFQLDLEDGVCGCESII